ncbi:MAG: methionyl-tRNA formyltransferase [Solirubrobacteraceae bacterium]|jgi:methionyl-tRNA formyltransferase|nr:methionyl-tRNA formyltransferase [Solirubrobacteraceae bacterium]
MRTVYLGTSGFAAAVLDRLAATPHRPQLVVTRPDRPRGRGRKLAAPPVADAARALGLELYQPESVNSDEARARIAAVEPDVVCVCAFGALIREPLLSEHEMLNVHPSLLPRWRGAAPVERAMMAGDERTGVTILKLAAGLDSGPIALIGEEPIAADDTYGTLAPRLQELGGGLLIRTLDEQPDFIEQSEDGVTYAEKIGPGDRTLDPDAPAEVNDRVVRALSPHIGARATLPDSAMLGVLRARPVEPSASGPLRADGDRLFLGGLELLEVQPPGGRPMGTAAFLRGHAL